MPTAAREYLAAALERLDLLIHREILRLRAGYQLSLDEFRGLYVSDEQVDHLVSLTLLAYDVGGGVPALSARAEELRAEAAAGRPRDEPLARIAREFGLVPFEEDVLLLALAPEVHLKYETLFAYLNNEVGRRWPTRDLAVRLFAGTSAADEDRWSAGRHLLPEAALFTSGLLRELEPAADHPATLAGGFIASAPAVRFALGLPLVSQGSGQGFTLLDAAEGGATGAVPDALAAEMRRAARLWAAASEAPVLVLEGDRGSSRAEAARAICRELGRPLLRMDATANRAGADGFAAVLRALALQQRLAGAAVYVGAGTGWTGGDGRPAADTRMMADLLGHRGGPLIVAGPRGTPWRELLGGRRCVMLRLAPPDHDARRRLWAGFLGERGTLASAETIGALADRFRLSAGQIGRAVAVAHDDHHLTGAPGGPCADALFRAAREESGHPLQGLATRVETMHRWGDLVLPPSTMRRVREVAAAVEHRHTVYATWGFDRRIGPGQGLRALFAGGSGTGKTMAAGVIARELGLDLYKIDLSGVVSKYIGETEKNLDRIFRAAHAGNAVLFFDEADALFGRRSEVKDAHDRYANLEVAYLLQRVEEHDGIVILATNARKNIDEAFARRMHYVVEFPLPDETHREHLWRGMFPPTIPLDAAVDFRFLARQFALSGGDIRNVALEAAFLAARDGRVVTMKHLVNAVARQLLKQGRIPSATEFRQYNALLVAE
jgi:hypothetical protein